MKRIEKHRIIIDHCTCFYMIIVFFCALMSSCLWAGHQNRTIISENGISNLIEIGLTIDELSSNEIAYTKKQSPYRRPGQELYRIEKMGIEFETLDDIIVRIWFFTEKDNAFKIVMPKDQSLRKIAGMTTTDIIDNFGEVTKYENQNAPKGIQGPLWLKYKPFGVAVNTIHYPDSPFHFAFNWDDTLSYITVSKVD